MKLVRPLQKPHQESEIKKQLKKLSKSALQVYSALSERAVGYHSIVYSLSIIETIQLLYLCMNDRFNSMFDNVVYTYALRLARYLNWIPGDEKFNLLSVIISSSLCAFIFCLLAVLILINNQKDKNINKGFSALIIKLFSLYALFFIFALQIPMAEVSYFILVCTDQTGIHTNYCSGQPWDIKQYLALFNLACVILQTVVFQQTLIDQNPLNNNSHVRYSVAYPTMKKLLNLTLPLLYALIVPRSQLAFSLLATLLQAFLLFYLLVRPPFGNFNIGLLSSILQSFLSVCSLFCSFQTGYETGKRPGNLSLIYLLVILVLVIFALLYWETKRITLSIYPKVLLKSSSKPLQQMLFSMILMVERSDTLRYRNKLHYCFKKLLSEKEIMKKMDAEVCEKLKDLITPIEGQSEDLAKDFKTDCYKLITTIIDTQKLVYKKDMYIRLLNAFILSERLDLKWKSLYEVETIIRADCPKALKISAARYLQQLEHEVQEKELVSAQTSGIDSRIILNSQEDYDRLKALLKESCEMTKKFWREIGEENPRHNLIQEYGFENAKIRDSVEKCYRAICRADRPRSLKIIQLYAQYNSLVLHDLNETKALWSRVRYLQETKQNNSSYGDNRKLQNFNFMSVGIIVARADSKQMGVIKRANQEARDITEMGLMEIIDQPLEAIMPQIYSDNHSKWMHRYFNTNQNVVLNKQRKVFTQNRRGFIIPIDLLAKVIPDLSQGLYAVGVFVLIEKLHPNTILFNGNTGEILGVSEGCYENFGMHPGLCYGNTQSSYVVNLLNFLPDFHSVSDLKRRDKLNSYHTFTTAHLSKLSYSSRSNFGDLSVSAPKASLLREYRVKLELMGEESHGLKGLSIVEMTITDFAKTKAGINLIRKMTDPHLRRTITTDKLQLDAKKLQEKHSLEAEKGKNQANLLEGTNHELAEAEAQIVEEKNEREEKGRKLIETQQMLKKRMVSSHIVVSYVLTILLAIVVMSGHLINMIISVEMMNHIKLNVYSTVIISKQETMVNRLSSLIIKYRNALDHKLREGETETTGYIRDQIHLQIRDLKDLQTECESVYIQALELSDKVQVKLEKFISHSWEIKGKASNISLTLQQAMYILVNYCESISTTSVTQFYTSKNPSIKPEPMRNYQFITDNYIDRFASIIKADLSLYHEEYSKTEKSIFYKLVGISSSTFIFALFSLSLILYLVYRLHVKVGRVTEIYLRVDKGEVQEFTQHCETFYEGAINEKEYFGDGYIEEEEVKEFGDMMVKVMMGGDSQEGEGSAEDSSQGGSSKEGKKKSKASPSKSGIFGRGIERLLGKKPSVKLDPDIGSKVDFESERAALNIGRSGTILKSPSQSSNVFENEEDLKTQREIQKELINSLKNGGRKSTTSPMIMGDTGRLGDTRRKSRPPSLKKVPSINDQVESNSIPDNSERTKLKSSRKSVPQIVKFTEEDEEEDQNLKLKSSHLNQIFKRFLLTAILWIPLAAYSLYRSVTLQKDAILFENHVGNLIQVKMSMSHIYSLMYHSISDPSAQSEIVFTPNDDPSKPSPYHSSLDSLQDALRESTRVSLPASIKEYSILYSSLVETSLCNTLIEGLDLNSCNQNSFLKSGLQTAVLGMTEAIRNVAVELQENDANVREKLLKGPSRVEEMGRL